jgi:hypothetical protein
MKNEGRVAKCYGCKRNVRSVVQDVRRIEERERRFRKRRRGMQRGGCGSSL